MTAQYPISICMAGAVSAGTYSAGAMSVLAEALRRLDDKTLDLPFRPPYDMLVKGMTGASAGSIQAVLSSLDLFSSSPTQELGKDAWLQVSFESLLGNDDLVDVEQVNSVLNSKSLYDNAAQRLAEHSSSSTWPNFVAPDYKLRLSVTNLRGVPYGLSFPQGNSLKIGLSHHHEYVRYRFTAQADKQYESIAITPLALTQSNLNNLVDGAIASSAFPLAFSPVELERANDGERNVHSQRTWLDAYEIKKPANDLYAVHYKSRTVLPSWNDTFGDINTLFLVDGGATDNEPVVEAFKVLFGDEVEDWEVIPDDVAGKVLFIDPFPNKVDKKIDSQSLRIDKSFGALAGALLSHARFSEKMVASLAHQNRVGLVYPKRPNLRENEFPMKSGALGGFSGFLKRDFLEHDYELGRLNMQRFLRYHFTTTKDDPMLAGMDAYIDYWAIGDRVPIIPMYEQDESGTYSKFTQGETEASKEHYYQQGLADFQAKFTVSDRQELRKALVKRFKKIVPILIDNHSGTSEKRYPDIRLGFSGRFKNTGFFKRVSNLAMGIGFRTIGAGFLSNSIVRTVEDSLFEQGSLAYRIKSSQDKVTDNEDT